MLTAEVKNLIKDKADKISQYDVLNDANYKFLILLQSRLTEAGVPYNDAMLITSHSRFDFDGINEEDDFIGDIALQYAEYCVKVYYRLRDVNLHRHLDSTTIQRFFNPPV